MSTVTAKPERVDQFFTVAEARFDRWRALLQAARTWEGPEGEQRPNKETSTKTEVLPRIRPNRVECGLSGGLRDPPQIL